MRCPDCNKFVGQEIGDPEVDLDITDERAESDNTVNVGGTVRVVLNCADCGTELKEATFDIDTEVSVEGHMGDGHVLEVSETGSEGTERQDGKPGTASRYRRTFYGASVSFEVACSCGQPTGQDGSNAEDTWSDDMQASSFDELV